MKALKTLTAIAALAIITLGHGLCYGETAMQFDQGGDKSQIVYDSEGKISAIVNYSRPSCKKSVIKKRSCKPSVSEWDARFSTKPVFSRRRYKKF
ncbi:hypothetical protein ACFL42_04045 [Candidatus Omnitrophota bacterium]